MHPGRLTSAVAFPQLIGTLFYLHFMCVSLLVCIYLNASVCVYVGVCVCACLYESCSVSQAESLVYFRQQETVEEPNQPIEL